MSFWTDNPNIITLVHDSNSGIGLIKNMVDNIKHGIEEGTRSPSDTLERLERIKEYANRLIKVIDIYYERQKKEYDTKK